MFIDLLSVLLPQATVGGLGLASQVALVGRSLSPVETALILVCVSEISPRRLWFGL